MKSLRNYYISRAIVSILFGFLFLALGADWWMGLLAGLLALVGFAWAPHSGRYSKQIQESGQVKLVHDEFTRSITDKAARNAFVISMIALASLSLYFWRTGWEAIPLGYFHAVLWIGLLGFAISDIVLRRGWFGRSNR